MLPSCIWNIEPRCKLQASRVNADTQIHAHIPTLSEIGLPPWVDPNEPPQKSLPPLLHSFLHTLLLLLDALTNTALTPIELYQRGIHHVGDPVSFPER